MTVFNTFAVVWSMFTIKPWFSSIRSVPERLTFSVHLRFLLLLGPYRCKRHQYALVFSILLIYLVDGQYNICFFHTVSAGEGFIEYDLWHKSYKSSVHLRFSTLLDLIGTQVVSTP